MKRITLLWAMLLCFGFAQAQTVEFSDDFENGTAGWTFAGTGNNWGLSTAYFNSASNSLTESPGGNYTANENSTATMAAGVDLSAALDANVSFWAIMNIEQGFDYMYVEASGDGGATWVQLHAFDTQDNLATATWTEFSYSLGGFVGSSDVKIRFRFDSDGGLELDGMHIDDFEVTSSSTDNGAPLIVHSRAAYYEAGLGDEMVSAEIIDISGLSMANLHYMVDGGAEMTVAGMDMGSNMWDFTIPAQDPGANVEYYITATDASANANQGTSANYHFIQGNYISYDNGVTDFIQVFGAASGSSQSAVRFTLDGATDIVAALIRNYTDVNNPNDDMLFHIWADDGAGNPGADLITPFAVTPEASLANTSPMTRVDLRPYSNELSNMIGDVHMGFSVPTGQVIITQSTPGAGMRSMLYDDANGVWLAAADGGGQPVDFHYRLITGPIQTPPSAAFSWEQTVGQSEVTFTDMSTGSPTTYTWDFGDGSATSDEMNPVHTYPAGSGSYSACLTVSNAVGQSGPICQTVDVVISATQDVIDNFSVTVAPNPFSNNTFISFGNSSLIQNAGFNMYNVLGERVAVDYNINSNGIQVERGNLTAGTYFFEITTNGQSLNRGKLVVR